MSGSTWPDGCVPTVTTLARRFGAGSCGCVNRGQSICCAQQKAVRLESLADQPTGVLADNAGCGLEFEENEQRDRSAMFRKAEEVQAAVRRRVDERTWQIFWNIAILGQSVRSASEAAGISYYAAFAAQKRVGRMLREEGPRLIAEWGAFPGPGGGEVD